MQSRAHVCVYVCVFSMRTVCVCLMCSFDKATASPLYSRVQSQVTAVSLCKIKWLCRVVEELSVVLKRHLQRTVLLVVYSCKVSTSL